MRCRVLRVFDPAPTLLGAGIGGPKAEILNKLASDVACRPFNAKEHTYVCKDQSEDFQLWVQTFHDKVTDISAPLLVGHIPVSEACSIFDETLAELTAKMGAPDIVDRRSCRATPESHKECAIWKRERGAVFLLLKRHVEGPTLAGISLALTDSERGCEKEESE